MSIGKFYLNSTQALRDLGSQVIALCIVIFLADVVCGVFVASFSVYASSAGMPIVYIGAVNTVAGIIYLGAALFIGSLSDRIGRPGLIITGVLSFCISIVLLIVGNSNNLSPLVVSRILHGLAGVAVFQIGQAHLGDLTTPSQRPLAYGLLSTSMALGFGLGPFIGGLITDCYGYATAYFSAAIFGVTGFIIAIVNFKKKVIISPKRQSFDLLAGVRLMTGQPNLRLAMFANLLTGLTFGGTLSTFLPLYGKELGFTQAAIGTMFAVRATVSATGRIGNSMLVRKVGNLPVMVFALLAITVATFGVGATTNPTIMMSFLALEGLAYGGFMVAGLTFVANHTNADNRGAAGGVYAMASGIGSSVAPWILGVVAEQLGIRAVFFTTATTLAIGVVIFAAGVVNLKAVKPVVSFEREPLIVNIEGKQADFSG